MSVVLRLVIEDEDGLHLREWGLGNYEDEDEAVASALGVVEDWYNTTGIEAWEVE